MEIITVPILEDNFAYLGTVPPPLVPRLPMARVCVITM